MKAQPLTAFPLIQTVMSTEPSRASGNAAVTSGGGTLSFRSTGKTEESEFRLVIPALFDTMFTGGGWYCYALVCGSFAELNMVSPNSSTLQWTAYGHWDSWLQNAQQTGAFATGYETPLGAIPTTGTATYTGLVEGRLFRPEAGWVNGIGIYWMNGDVSLQANFGNHSISGTLTNLTAGGAPWNTVALGGTMAAGANAFAGTTSATTAPVGVHVLAASATGTFAGRFFGPAAQELGAVWTLSDGTSTAIGSFGAKSGP